MIHLLPGYFNLHVFLNRKNETDRGESDLNFPKSDATISGTEAQSALYKNTPIDERR